MTRTQGGVACGAQGVAQGRLMLEWIPLHDDDFGVTLWCVYTCWRYSIELCRRLTESPRKSVTLLAMTKLT